MNSRKLNAENSSAQISPSLVVIIVILTIIFFLSAFLHLLIRWLARNPRIPQSRLPLTALQAQLQQLFNIHDSGVEQELIDTLPVFFYNTVVGLKEGADCAVCLCEFASYDQLRLLPNCSHAFHTHCIDAWLLSHSTCPLCRQALQPEFRALHMTTGEGMPVEFDRSSVVGYGERDADLQREGQAELSGDNMSSGVCAAARSLMDGDISSIVSQPGLSQQDDMLNSASARSTSATEGRLNKEELRRSSSRESGRRLSIQLGRCKIVHENSSSAARAGASLRFYSKGSYEYVVEPCNLEVVITPMSYGTSPPYYGHIGLQGHRTTLSAEDIETNISPTMASMSSCFSSGSFSRLRTAREEVAVAARDPKIPILSLRSTSDTDSSTIPTTANAKIARTDETADKGQSSLLNEQILSCHKIFMPGERSKRAVSFRLPAAATAARLKTGAKRRALSETDQLAASDWQAQQVNSEADSLWEMPSNDHQLMQPPCIDNHPGANVISHTVSVNCSVLPSSNLANRTMDWLTQGWQKRHIHPDSAVSPA